MFGMGAQEIAIIAVILIIVVGPDDLPGMLRTIGKWIGNIQGMAKDFRRQIDTMADDAGFAEERKMLDQARNLNPTKIVKDALDPTGEISKDLEKADREVSEASVAARTESSLNQDLWKPEKTSDKPGTASPAKKVAAVTAGTKKPAAKKTAAKKSKPKKATAS